MRGGRTLITAFFLSCATLTGGAAEESVTLTSAQSRALAQAALTQGQPALTKRIADTLIAANPSDAHALLLLSAANRALGAPDEGRRAARRAYRHAGNSAQKLQAAQMAAQSAFDEKRPTLSQIWLRRAALHTQTETEADTLARAYGRVRASNPVSVHLGFSIRPSSNVNNGADSALNVIEGVSAVGYISPASQALSGTVATTDLTLGYRLHETKTSRTDARLRGQLRRVALSNEAKAKAPGVSGSDFGWSYAEGTLSHVFALAPERGAYLRVGATYGGFWSGNDLDYSLARLDAEHIWAREAGRRWSLGGSVTEYDRGNALNNSRALALRGTHSRKLDNGDTLGLTLALESTTSDNVNRAHEAANLRMRYAFADRWGPAEAAASLTLSYADYADFTAVGTVVGRTDKGAVADLTLFFPDFDYAGFAPKVTLRAGRKTSSISLYESREFSVNFGIESKF